MLALKRENLPLQDSEPCLKTKRTVMPDVFLFPPEICLELLEVEEVNENEEFWQDILSPYPERDETSTESEPIVARGGWTFFEERFVPYRCFVFHYP